jgi:biopolymer transport protein ExbD
MRLRRPERPFEGENILPLINVVFLLLIFFLLAGQMKPTEIIAVEPPNSASEAKPRSQAGLLLIGADGRVALGENELNDTELFETVSVLVEEAPGIVLRLKADRAVDAARAIDVMTILHNAGVEKVTLMTEQRTELAP